MSRHAGDSALFEDAAEAAREIEDAGQRAYALGEVGMVSGTFALFDEALSALEGLNGAKLAYALSDLAAASGNVAFVDQIDAAYPDARVSAYLRMGAYQSAWEAAVGILDPFEQARAQAAIAGAWGSGEAAHRISIPLYHDMALRDVIRKTGDAKLVDSISSTYYKVQGLTALGEYESAMQLAGDLGDAYPLVELSLAFAETNPQAVLDLVDEMDREADKAVVLRTVAGASQDQELIERAQGMALAARVRGDVLAPTQALLDLAEVLWAVDPANAGATLDQALEAAQRITTK